MKSTSNISDFWQFNLDKRLLSGIAHNNLKHSLLLQQKSMHPLLQGSNAIVQGDFYSGKTTLSVITALANIDASLKEIQAIILIPTAEKLFQTWNIAFQLSIYLGIVTYALAGVMITEETIRRLQEGVHY